MRGKVVPKTMPVKIFARHTAERVRPAIQRGVAHLLTGTASSREQPLALNTELLGRMRRSLWQTSE